MSMTPLPALDLDAVRREFALECEEILVTVEGALLRLEARPDDGEALSLIFRGAHTLKGSASCVGFDALAEVAHVMEDVLERMQRGTSAITSKRITTMLGALDLLRAMAGAPPEEAHVVPARAHALIARLRDESPEPDLDARSSPESPELPESPGARTARRTLRVDVEKLDRMLTLSGEIAVARERLAAILEGPEESRVERALDAHRDADRLHADLQELVTRARMVPVEALFQSFKRTVRDLAEQLGKQADLVIEGEDVEVDTAVVEQLKAPLTHMIRNAIDHGLEAPEARLAAGKSARGRVVLRARHDGGNVSIELSDDGRGLDRARLLEKAVARGLVADPSALSTAAIDELVFEPGLSTATEVTDVSGRGVGMDVVRRSIEELRGTLSIESAAGRGTTITASLPLTLAIISGFNVGVDGVRYVIPMSSVIECLERKDDETLPACGRGVVNLRGEPLPFVRLRDVFEATSAAPSRESVVVVHHAGSRAGLAVDTLFGESQTVIKPLGRPIKRIAGIVGSAILGSGHVALILDVPGLMRRALSRDEGVVRS